MNEEELRKLGQVHLDYTDRIERQKTRISLLVEFLEERGILVEFLAWEAARQSASN